MSLASVETDKKPFEMPFHFRTLGNLSDDVRAALTHRLMINRAAHHLRATGHLQSIDTSRFPPQGYEYGLHVDALISRFHPEVDGYAEQIDKGVKNWAVYLLSTGTLRFLHNTFEFAKGYRRFLSEDYR